MKSLRFSAIFVMVLLTAASWAVLRFPATPMSFRTAQAPKAPLPSASAIKARADERYGKLPMSFEASQGQWNAASESWESRHMRR